MGSRSLQAFKTSNLSAGALEERLVPFPNQSPTMCIQHSRHYRLLSPCSTRAIRCRLLPFLALAVLVAGSSFPIPADGASTVVEWNCTTPLPDGLTNVLAEGTPPLAYQWKKGGEEIPGATASTLTLTNVQLDAAGDYSVAVTNAFGGSRSAGASLAVAPILMSTPPRDAVTFDGGSVTFSLSVQATPPWSYQWQFNGQDLVGATGAMLTLSNAQPGQAGTYAVTVSNSFGTVQSAAATLRVVPIAVWPDWRAQSAVPAGLTDVVAIAAAQTSASPFTLALKADGHVVAWGSDDSGQTDVPADATNVISIAAGQIHSLVLRADGTVVAWGDNYFGQAVTPPGLSGVVAVAAGANFSLALKADGTLRAWGYTGSIQVPRSATHVVAIAAGSYHGLALRQDGTVVAWGGHYPDFSQTNVPPGMTNIVAIAAGSLHSVALRADGGVVVWGDTSGGLAPPPAGLSNIVGMAGGDFHDVALRADGTVSDWGLGRETGVPPGLTNVVEVAAGGGASLALIGEGPPLLRTALANPGTTTNGFEVTIPTQSGHVYRLEYKNALSDTNWTALPLVPGTGSKRALVDPTLTSSQRFYRVRRW